MTTLLVVAIAVLLVVVIVATRADRHDGVALMTFVVATLAGLLLARRVSIATSPLAKSELRRVDRDRAAPAAYRAAR